MSQSTTDENKDIAIPNADDWRTVCKGRRNNNNRNNDEIWKKKNNEVIFRGTSTGCGLTTETNPRLRLSEISHLINEPEKINIGLSALVKKVKVNNFTFGYIDYKNNEHLIKGFISPSEQENKRFQLNIEGNVSAYRYGSLFNRNSVVIQTESQYKLWFEPLLRTNKDFILLEKDVFMREGDDIEESKTRFKEWIDGKMGKESEKEMMEVIKNGKDFNKKYMNKKVICEYFYQIMKISNSYYKYD
jgi:hypothetical protein